MHAGMNTVHESMIRSSTTEPALALLLPPQSGSKRALIKGMDRQADRAYPIFHLSAHVSTHVFMHSCSHAFIYIHFEFCIEHDP
jgi:hypothetical protein